MEFNGTVYDILNEATNNVLAMLTGIVQAVYAPKDVMETEVLVLVLLDMIKHAVVEVGLPDVETYSVQMPIDNNENKND